MSNCCESCATDIISCMVDGTLQVFAANLVDGETYVWVITDNKGNRYQKDFTYNAGQGYFEIDVATDLPPGLLNEHDGNFKLHIQKTIWQTGSVPFMFNKSVDCIEISIKCSDFFSKTQLGG